MSTSRMPIHLFAVGWLTVAAVFLPLAAAGEPKGKLSKFAATRTWKDATGKFSIEGQLRHADINEVQLTQSNGKTVKIPLEKLSDADRAFVEGFLKAEKTLGNEDSDPENPFKVMGDKSPDTTTSKAGMTADKSEIKKVEPILKGAKQIVARMESAFWSANAPRGFPDVEFDDAILKTTLSKPFFAGLKVACAGKAGICVLNSYQQGRGAKENYGRFVVARASDGEVSEPVEFTDPWKLMAISPDGGRIAAVRVEGHDKGNDVALFRVTADGVLPEYQFRAGGGAWDELHFIGFCVGGRLVTISQKHTLTVWDLSNGSAPKALYTGNSGGALSAELSPAGELMILPAGNSIAVIDMTNAKVVGLIARDSKATQLAFSPDGTQIAAFAPFEVTLYSTSDGQEIRKMAVSEHQPNASLIWVGKYLRIGSAVYDVNRSLPVWTYENSASSQTSLGNYLISAFGGDNSSTVSILKIPHEQAVAASSQVEAADTYAIQPGDTVSVDYQFVGIEPDVQAAVAKAVEAKVEKLGWRIASAANNSMTVIIEQGKQGTEEYYTRQGFGPIAPPPGFGRPSGPLETVTFIPYTHRLKIVSGDEVLYEASMVRGAPDGLTTKEGESTQAAVNRYCQPWPGYFEQLPIPPFLLKKEYQGGFGKSKIDASGIR